MNSRVWVRLQLAIAWLPMWVLFTVLVSTVHGTPLAYGALRSLTMIVPGALLGFLVYRFTTIMPWPHPFRFGFVVAHVVAATIYAVCWWLGMSAIDSIITGRFVLMVGPGIGAILVTGLWLYLVVAGVAYANRATERAAQLEAQAAHAQLDALRAQLHPHFLFNALHTVVQLIPIDPRAATRAAEQLAAALRTTMSERRDLIEFSEELAFVERYLAIESIRFGDRLVVNRQVDAAAHDVLLPSFALQTLVENALRHGAAPRSEPTQLTISAESDGDRLVVQVRDDGGGADPEALANSKGTGLQRLRERLRWLYGIGATLEIATAPGAGFRATLRVPQARERDSDNPRSDAMST